MTFLKRRKKMLLKITLGGSLLLALVLLFWFTPIRGYVSVSGLFSLVDAMNSRWEYITLFYAAFMLGILVMPVTVFPIVGGLLLNYWLALLLNCSVATLGAFIAFLIGRCFGREAVGNFIRGRLKSFDKKTARQGFLSVFVLRVVGVPPFAIANYALGISRIRCRDFLAGTFLGILPWMAFVTYLSGHLLQAMRQEGERGFFRALAADTRPMIAVSTLVLLSVVFSWWFQNRRKSSAPQPT